MNEFELFKQKAEILGTKLSQVEEIFGALQKDETGEEKKDILVALDDLHVAKEKLAKNTFKVLVVGEFKRGKSTLINALLKNEILPAYATPCTAVINEITYGKEQKAKIFFKPDICDLPDGLSKEVQNHINKHDKKNLPPLEVSFESFKKCVVIPDPGKEQAQSIFESPFVKAVIEYPLDICKNGIEIIDSPGLNENKTRNDITNNYLSNADAIIFVLLCDPLASQSEMESIEGIYNSGHKNIFYVCNRFDSIRGADDQKRVIDFAKEKLLSFTNLGERGLHFISARDALDFYTEPVHNDPKLLEKSRFEPMRKSLESFLINDRGRLKLSQPCEMAKILIEHKIDAIISSVIKGMSGNCDELKRRVDDQNKKLAELQKKVEKEEKGLHAEVENIGGMIVSKSQRFIYDLADKIPRHIQECDTDTSLGLFGKKSTVEAIVEELRTDASWYIKEQKKEWEKESMFPEIQRRFNEFKEALRESIKNIAEDLKGIKDDFDADASETNEDFCRDFGMLTEVESPMFDGILATAISGILTGLGAALLGLLAPWLFLPAIISGFFLGGGIGKLVSNESRMDDIKKKVGEALKQQIISEGLKNIDTAANPIKGKLNHKIDETFKKVNQEIEGIMDDAQRQLEASKLAGEELKAKKLFFEKITEQKEQLLEDFKAILSKLSNPNYCISEGATEDIFSQLAKVDIFTAPKEMAPPVEEILPMEHEKKVEILEDINIFEHVLLETGKPAQKKDNDMEALEMAAVPQQKKKNFFQRLKYLFRGDPN